MKNRLTKFFTVFLAVVLCIGMAPATGSTAYAASRWGGSSISSLWNSLFGGSDSGSNKNNSSSNSNQAGKNDATGQDSNQLTTTSADETGTANEIQLTKKAVANGTTEDGKPKFNIQLGVQGKEVKKGAPVDFTLVVDLSASMTDYDSQSLAITKTAAKSFIETVLADGNTNVRVAIVAYGTMGHAYNFTKKSWNLYGSTETDGYYTSDRQKALNVINSNNFAPKKLSPTSGDNFTDYESGGTNTEAGFLTAQAVTATRNSNAMSKVVFMTDGVPTYHYSDGTTVTGGKNTTTEADFNEAVSAGKALKAAGNDIYTVGLLTSYGEGSAKLEMANKLLSDKHSYSYGRTSSVSYNEITRNKYNDSYYEKRDNLWIEDGENYVQVQVDREWNGYQFTYTYTYTQKGETKTETSTRMYSDPGLTLYTKTEHQGTLGYTENGAAYSDKYYPITDANTAADQIKEIYTNIAKESLVLATGDIVDYIPDGFTVDETSVREAGGTISTDASGKTIVKFPGVPAGKDVATKTFTVVYTGDKYGVAYTNTKATYSGTLYDNNKFSKDFPLPVVGLNPATTDDEYYLDPNTVSNLAILDNDKLNQIAEDGYNISDLQVTLLGVSDLPEGVTAKAKEVDDKYVVVFNGPAGDYEFNYKITATATKGNSSVGIPAEGQDGWNADKTQFTITSRVTNVKVHIVAAANQAFIVDFGKPVTYKADRVFTKSEQTADINVVDGNGEYGNMSINDDKDITYTLTKFMDGIDTFTFNENYKGKKQLSKDVLMVPGTSIYYEDNFENINENGNKSTAITYDGNWTVLDKDNIEGDSIQGVIGDGETGYDSNYNKDDSKLSYSAGTIHMIQAPSDATAKATFEFTGTGVDIYSLTNGITGKIQVAVWKQKEDGTYPKTAVYRKTIDTKYNSGTAYQLPVVNFRGNEATAAKYKVQITVGKGQTFYLDAVRIYNPIGNVSDYYGEESGVKYLSIRQQSLNPTKFTVTGDVFIDAYLKNPAKTVTLSDTTTEEIINEYTNYGRKTEVVIAPGKTVTLTLEKASSFLELGARIDAEAPKSVEGGSADGKVTVNGNPINVNSSTDMYYTISADSSNTIEITNNTNKLIAITNLKLK
ncbi:MAG: vWA domain-containing protein [Intestinibacter bartlettii]|nr:vWA domain-containing protein [Intestinibacter bartlettii]